MKEYFIRGQIVEASVGSDDSCPSQAPRGTQRQSQSDIIYRLSPERFRIEVWDRDNRFDDRLASSTTFLGGVIELRFNDEDFRLEPGETELKPDLFFKIFRQRQELFSTEEELVPETRPSSGEDFFESVEEIPSAGEASEFILTLPVEVNQNKQGYRSGDTCYRIEIFQAFVREIPEEPEREEVSVPDFPSDTVVDILPTYDHVTAVGRSRAITPTESRGGSLQQVVNNAFNRVLGQTFQAGEGAKFRNSLDRAFTFEETNGQRNYILTPRTYTPQNELGGTISGAQASLYHRAKAALKEILPLLDSLYALDPSTDEQNEEAVRAIIRTEIIELVNEMGVHQGPRIQRVDSLFELLIGSSNITIPEQYRGQLRDLANILGLNRSLINTVDEEQNYSNLLIIRDYMFSLRESWNNYINDTGSGAYIGTQLVLLSQALSVVAESVRETYHIMDLVFLRAEERQSVWIDFTKAKDKNASGNIAFYLPDGTGYSQKDTAQLQHSMDVERLLSWVLQFSTKEGPVLARSGGKLGIVNAIADTSEKLMILVQAASYVPVPNSAFRREGVVRALRDLAFQIYQVNRLAKEVIPPIISGEPDDIGDRSLSITQRPRGDTLS